MVITEPSTPCRWPTGIQFRLPTHMEHEDDNLWEVPLPAGDVSGFVIAYIQDPYNNGADSIDPSFWLSKGYKGVRFVGKGIDVTNIRCVSWDAHTLYVKTHPGIVQFEDCTIDGGLPSVGYGAKPTAIHFGEKTKADGRPKYPQFRFVGKRVKFIGRERYDDVGYDGNEPGWKRTTWLLFTYQADISLTDCVFDGTVNTEHNIYAHGLASRGINHVRTHHLHSGADQLKLRSDAEETWWAGPDTTVNVVDSTFADWYRPNSWRGGAAIDMQGACSNVHVKNCTFTPGDTGFWDGAGDWISPAARSKMIFVSGEGNSYDVDTGQVNVGHGNGYVYIQRCLGETGGPGKASYDDMLSIATWGGSQQACKGWFMDNCGFWGELMNLTVGDTPLWGIRGCNTANIIQAGQEQGYAATDELIYFGTSGITPISTRRPYGPA